MSNRPLGNAALALDQLIQQQETLTQAASAPQEESQVDFLGRPLLAAPIRQQEALEAPGFVRGTLLPTAARIGGAVGGGLLGGIPGAIAGGAAGEVLAETLEGREQISSGETLVAGLFSGIPVVGKPAATLGAQVLKRGAQGALFGVTEETARSLVRDGDLPQVSTLGLATGLGFVLGGGAGALELRWKPTPGVESTTKPKPVYDESGSPVSEAEITRQLEFDFSARPTPPPNTDTLGRAVVVAQELDRTSTGGRGGRGGRGGQGGWGQEERFAGGSAAARIVQLEPRFTTESVEVILDFARRHPDMLLLGDKRLYQEVAEVLRQKGGVSEEFVDLFIDTISGGGKQLNRLSQLTKSLVLEAKKANPNLASKLDLLNRILTKEDSVWGRAMRATSSLINIWRGLLVVQPVTVTRNILTQFPTYSTKILDKWLGHHLGGKGLEEAQELLVSMAANFKALARKGPKGLQERLTEIEKLVTLVGTGSSQKRWLARQLLNMQMAEMPDRMPEWLRWLNGLNLWQEQFFRRTAFDGIWRGLAREAGLDVAEILADPSKMPEEIFEKAIVQAMEMTYAADPKGKIGKAVMQLYDAVPPVALVHPFPRFYMNAFNFLVDHSPAGVTRIWQQARRINTIKKFVEDNIGDLHPRTLKSIEKRLAKEQDKMSEQIAMALVGTAGLAMGLAIRSSPIAGPKYFQIKTSEGKLADVKPFNPLTGYLFFADVLTTMGEIGVDYIRNGFDLEEALNKRFKLNRVEFVEGVTQLSTRTGVGLPFLQAVFGKVRGEEAGNLLVRAAAEFLGGFTVPFRAVTDVIQGLGWQDNIIRDSRDSILGPALKNLPIISSKLPELATITRGEPVRSEHPLIRQFSGLNLKKRNLVERELDRLQVETFELEERTGQPELDRKINRVAGSVVGFMAERLVASPAYKDMNEATQRLMWSQVFTTARRVGRLAALRDPELATANLEEILQQVRAPIREWLREDPRAIELRRRLKALDLAIP